MSILIGEKIKKRAKELRMGPTELGRLINTSKQNIYTIYKRKSLDTDLLRKLSEVLDFDFFIYYRKEKESGSLNMVREKQNIYTTNSEIKNLTRKIESLENEVKILHERLTDKERIIELMSKKK